MCDPEPSSPPNLDSCQNAASKNNYPKVEGPLVSDSSTAQNDIDDQSLSPPALDPCQCVKIFILIWNLHLVQQGRSTIYQISHQTRLPDQPSKRSQRKVVQVVILRLFAFFFY